MWLVPAVVAVALFANSIGNGFVRDDKLIIEHNELIRDIGTVGTIVRTNYWQAKGINAGPCRPLTILSYAADHVLFGLDSRAVHASNVALHALARCTCRASLLCGLASLAVHQAVARLPSPSMRRLTLPMVTLALVLPLTVRTVVRDRDWHSETTLYLHDVEVAPNRASLRFNAASILLDQNRVDEAVAHLEQSLHIYPTGQASYKLGQALGRLGDEDGRRARYVETAARFPGTFWSEYASAGLAANDKRYEDARTHYQNAVALNPFEGNARYNLGILELALGDPAARSPRSNKPSSSVRAQS